MSENFLIIDEPDITQDELRLSFKEIIYNEFSKFISFKKQIRLELIKQNKNLKANFLQRKSDAKQTKDLNKWNNKAIASHKNNFDLDVFMQVNSDSIRILKIREEFKEEKTISKDENFTKIKEISEVHLQKFLLIKRIYPKKFIFQF